jgi:hypothetical protein
MFRFDGEVFLLGTAIAAPSHANNKNCDDLRLISAECPAGGARIVANRGSYSETADERKRRSRDPPLMDGCNLGRSGWGGRCGR